jgi:hypothetical protein
VAIPAVGVIVMALTGADIAYLGTIIVGTALIVGIVGLLPRTPEKQDHIR